MVAEALKKIWLLGPQAITGPIFGKELRVSSRRRRYYVMRSIYIALLILFIGGVWAAVNEDMGGSAWTVAQMESAGQVIVGTVIWCQFGATQLFVLISFPPLSAMKSTTGR